MDITKKMYDRARKAGDKIGVLPNSIRKGQGNTVGKIGEEMFNKFYPDNDWPDTTQFDFTLVRNDCLLRIEMKAKEHGPYKKPELDYEGSVTWSEKAQDCDIYYFSRVHKDTRVGWLCGWMWKEEFFKQCFLIKKGERFPNGFVCSQDCWNIYYHQCHSPEELLEEYQE